MIRFIWMSVLAVLTAATLAACGGGGTAKDTAGQENGATMSDKAADQGASGDETPAVTPVSEPGDTAQTAETENAEALPSPATYETTYDPDAVYTLSDITMKGSYLKIDFEGLSDSELNRVIHRLRTEHCTCGCDDTIDKCLITDPNCSTAVTLAKQVIREEKTKG